MKKKKNEEKGKRRRKRPFQVQSQARDEMLQVSQMKKKKRSEGEERSGGLSINRHISRSHPTLKKTNARGSEQRHYRGNACDLPG